VIKNSKPKDWVLLVNNDVELSRDAIVNLIDIAEKKNRRALLGALTVSAEDKKTVITSGTTVKSWFLNKTKHLYKGLNKNKIQNNEPVEVDFLTGRSLLHPVEIFDIAGNYNSKVFTHYGADDEFSMRVKKYGYSTLLCPSSVVFLHSNKDNKNKKKNLKNFFFIMFGKKSSSNIINKFNLTLLVVPLYAKISFFLIGVMKSVYIFFKNDR
jgi:GT2 family glycosyltransferase